MTITEYMNVPSAGETDIESRLAQRGKSIAIMKAQTQVFVIVDC